MRFDENEMTGVYIIESLNNKKVYIGATRCFPERWGRHIAQLIKRDHHNRELQEDFNKYGLNNFNFEILECCYPDEIFELEKEYIREYNCQGYNLYNIIKNYDKKYFKPSQFDEDIWLYSDEAYYDYEER